MQKNWSNLPLFQGIRSDNCTNAFWNEEDALDYCQLSNRNREAGLKKAGERWKKNLTCTVPKPSLTLTNNFWDSCAGIQTLDSGPRGLTMLTVHEVHVPPRIERRPERNNPVKWPKHHCTPTDRFRGRCQCKMYYKPGLTYRENRRWIVARWR